MGIPYSATIVENYRWESYDYLTQYSGDGTLTVTYQAIRGADGCVEYTFHGRCIVAHGQAKFVPTFEIRLNNSTRVSAYLRFSDLYGAYSVSAAEADADPSPIMIYPHEVSGTELAFSMTAQLVLGYGTKIEPYSASILIPQPLRLSVDDLYLGRTGRVVLCGGPFAWAGLAAELELYADGSLVQSEGPYNLNNQTGDAGLSFSMSADAWGPVMANTMRTQGTVVVRVLQFDTVIDSANCTVPILINPGYLLPSVGETSISDAQGYADVYGAYVLGQSRLMLSVQGSALYGAEIRAVTIRANGAYYHTTPVTTAALRSAAYTSVEFSVTDSRGQTSPAVTRAIPVLDWIAPRVTEFAIHRCNADGSANDLGGSCRIDWGVRFSELNGQNSRALSIRHSDGSTEIALAGYIDSGSLIVPADTERSFVVALVLTDDFCSVVRELELSTATVPLDLLRGGNGIAFGKVAELARYVDLDPRWTLRVSKLLIGSIYLQDWLATIERRTVLAAHPVGSYYWTDDVAYPGDTFGGNWDSVAAAGGPAAYCWRRTEDTNTDSSVVGVAIAGDAVAGNN